MVLDKCQKNKEIAGFSSITSLNLWKENRNGNSIPSTIELIDTLIDLSFDIYTFLIFCLLYCDKV